MSNGKIRFFDSTLSESEPSTIIGFSRLFKLDSVQLADELSEKFALENQTIRTIDAPVHLSHLACEFIEVVPPLDDRQIRRFATACLKSVDTGSNSVDVVDNRIAIPERVLQNAGEVIAWV